MKAYQIFQSISPDLGKQIFQDLREEHREVYKSIVVSLTQQRNLRPVFIQRKPVPQQIEWMVKTAKLKPVDSVSEHLLQIWLLKSQKDMLITFLDELEIEHDEDGTVEDLPESLDQKKLKSAVDKLLKDHAPESVGLYLHVFQLQQPGGWTELTELLEKDERLALGGAKKAEPKKEEAEEKPAEEESA